MISRAFRRPSSAHPYAATFSDLAEVVRSVHVARERTLDTQLAIARTAAPTGAEAARGQLVAQLLRDRGIADVRQDAVGNIIARVPASGALYAAASASETHGDRAPVLVLAHLDTVFAESELPAPRVEGTRVYAPGIGDNSRGLAAMITIAEAMRHPTIRSRPHRPIEFIATVGEEGAGNLRGVRHLFAERSAAAAPAPTAVIALDGPGDTLIVHHAIASQRLRLTMRGAGGHPWADASVPNAAHAIGRAVSAIAQFADAQRDGVTISVTRIGGGEGLTSIPTHAWCEVDVRTRQANAMPQLLNSLSRLVERARADTSAHLAPHDRNALTLQTEILGDRPGGALDITHPLVQLAQAATRWQGGEPQSASSSSDANIPLSLGIPSITIGAGGTGGRAHTREEWYDDGNSANGVARALGIIVAAAAH